MPSAPYGRILFFLEEFFSRVLRALVKLQAVKANPVGLYRHASPCAGPLWKSFQDAVPLRAQWNQPEPTHREWLGQKSGFLSARVELFLQRSLDVVKPGLV